MPERLPFNGLFKASKMPTWYNVRNKRNCSITVLIWAMLPYRAMLRMLPYRAMLPFPISKVYLTLIPAF